MTTTHKGRKPRRKAARTPSTMRRHSVSILGHRTSVSVEDAFWAELKRIARRDDKSIARVIQEIDIRRAQNKDAPNLSSAIRLHILEQVKIESILRAPDRTQEMVG